MKASPHSNVGLSNLRVPTTPLLKKGNVPRKVGPSN